MNKYLEPYVPLMDFLAAFLGKSTEIVLHDLMDWHCSVVAIRNGHISGREMGSPVTDLALQVLNEAKYKDVPYISGYQSRAKMDMCSSLPRILSMITTKILWV